MRQLFLLLAISAALAVRAAALDVGDHAPALAHVTWVKGEAPKADGAITVVEFWATWCGPCRESIPHLTSLQKQYGDRIQIAGLSNEERATVEPFVKSMGEKMEYHVGIADKDTYAGYMEGIDGIPHAFLLDATGTVVWQGHPAAIAEPLAQLTSGKLDVAKVKQIAKLEKELQGMLQGQQPDLPKAIAKVDEILAIDAVNQQAIGIRMAIGNYEKKPEMVRETLSRIPLAQLDAEQANGLAWSRAVDETLANRNLDLALGFIHRALELEPENPTYIDTRARLEYALGEVDEALASELRASALKPGDEGLIATVAYYRQVLELRKHGKAPAPKSSTPP